MLSSNKTYDNSNLRDKQKTFNDGILTVYTAEERILKEVKGEFYFSIESVSFDKYLQAHQNSKTVNAAVGIPESNIPVEHNDVVKIGNDFYKVTHAQRKDFESPNWYKLYLEKATIAYETI